MTAPLVTPPLAGLPAAFTDWWFAPWALAPASDDVETDDSATDDAAHDPASPAARDLLGRRDDYRRWCARAGIPAALPAQADRRWSALATLDGAELEAAARMLGGLFAARSPLAPALAGLAPHERRWCAGVASVQPLPRAPWPAASGLAAGPAGVGLAWLALCLERGFPGLWPRLRLRLTPALSGAAERCLEDGATVLSDAALARLAHCWSLCLSRSRAQAPH